MIKLTKKIDKCFEAFEKKYYSSDRFVDFFEANKTVYFTYQDLCFIFIHSYLAIDRKKFTRGLAKHYKNEYGCNIASEMKNF